MFCMGKSVVKIIKFTVVQIVHCDHMRLAKQQVLAHLNPFEDHGVETEVFSEDEASSQSVEADDNSSGKRLRKNQFGQTIIFFIISSSHAFDKDNTKKVFQVCDWQETGLQGGP